jgi:Arc/MetJ-type ribon-helix-helix transcriptional regulator
MSRQIAVRLPDDIVEFVDDLVSEGAADSRAAVVRHALHRERRESLAMRDAEILAAAGADADMDSLAEHVRRIPLDLP